MLTPTIERDAIIASFAEVAEQSFFAFAEPLDGTPEDVSTFTEWMEARVGFTGPYAGRMTVTLPVSLGYELCGSFLGYGPEDPLDRTAVEDLVGELANMACGAWLTNAKSTECFALTHPEVTRVAQPPTRPLLWMSCNGQPISFTLGAES